MTFEADITAYAKRTNQRIDSAVREIVMTVATAVDERSPVGKKELWAINIDRATRGLPAIPKGYIGGHFRMNNQYRFGSVPSESVDGVDPSGGVALARIEAGLEASPAAGVHYIANTLPYAAALEFGHSSQAPQGIYGLAAIDVASAINKVTA